MALQLVYNEYYRDPNLDTDYRTSFPVASGTISPATPFIGAYGGAFGLKSRCWSKDYFTSALPFVQRGPAAAMPANVTNTVASGTRTNPANVQITNPDNKLQVVGSPSNLDITQTANITINDLRRTSAVS